MIVTVMFDELVYEDDQLWSAETFVKAFNLNLEKEVCRLLEWLHDVDHARRKLSEYDVVYDNIEIELGESLIKREGTDIILYHEGDHFLFQKYGDAAHVILRQANKTKILPFKQVG